MQKLKARAIAFYLPQYHPVKENDDYWGKGFTEWTNVVKSKPLFEGHIQPKLPTDLGLYDLRVPEVRQQQADMAREHGVEAFCYWHYWFGNKKRVLERIFDEVLGSGEPDFPFCLGWANDSWTGKWHGMGDDVVLEQTYPSTSDMVDHFYTLLPAFRDKRYFTVDGKPLFLIYKPLDLPNSQAFVSLWQELALSEGLSGLFLVGVKNKLNYQEISLDGYTNSRFAKQSTIYKQSSFRACPDLVDYTKIIEDNLKAPFSQGFFPTVIPNWDNTPRCGVNGSVYVDATPKKYYSWLKGAIEKLQNRPFQQRLIFLKSWNEWAEGNYLEPDISSGKENLEMTLKALISD